MNCAKERGKLDVYTVHYGSSNRPSDVTFETADAGSFTRRRIRMGFCALVEIYNGIGRLLCKLMDFRLKCQFEEYKI